MNDTDHLLEIARENQLGSHLDNYAKSEKMEELREEEALDLISCRLAESIETMIDLKKELMKEYGDMEHLDFKEMILEEVEGML